MDLCRTLIVAALATMLIQASQRLSYDSGHGLRLAAAAASRAPA